MDRINWLVIVLAVLPAVYSAVFVHELGHAVMGRAMGYIVTSFGLGVGRPLAVFSVWGSKVYFCRSRMHLGLTFAVHPAILPARARIVTYLTGGIVFNVCAAVFSLMMILWGPWLGGIWIDVLFINANMAITSSIPSNIRIGRGSQRTDGAQIVQVMRTGSLANPPSITAQTFEFMQRHAAMVGDTVISYVNLLSVAEAWTDLEEYDRASEVLEQAQARPDCGIPGLRWLQAYITAQLAVRTQKCDDALASLDIADAAAQRLGGKIGVLSALLRDAISIERGDTAHLPLVLEQRIADPDIRSLPSARLMSVVTRLAVAIRDADLDSVRKYAAEYDRLAKKSPSAMRDLKLCRILARLYAQVGDSVAARLAYQRVLVAIIEAGEGWTDPAEARRFFERYQPLADEARAYLEASAPAHRSEVVSSSGASLGMRRDIPPKSVDVIKIPLTPEGVREWREGGRVDRDQRLRSYAYRMMLLNVIVIVLGVILGAPSALSTSVVLFFAPLLILFPLVLFTAAGIIYLVLDVSFARFSRSLRTSGGAVLLMLACLPWPILMVNCIVMFEKIRSIYLL